MIIVIIVMFLLFICIGFTSWAYDKDTEPFFFGIGGIGLVISGFVLLRFINIFSIQRRKKNTNV